MLSGAQGVEPKNTKQIITDAYKDYLSTQVSDLANPSMLLSRVEKEINEIEDLDDFVDQAKYAIVMKTISNLANNNLEEIVNYRNLDTDSKYEEAIPYQWQPKEYDQLDDLLWDISCHAFDIIIGEEEPMNDAILELVAEARHTFDYMWSNTTEMQTSYGNHLYLVDLLLEKEDEFYKDVAIIQGIETEDYSENLMGMLVEANIDLGETYIEPVEMDTEIMELLDTFEGTIDELVAKIKSEGYEILDCDDGNITIGEGFGLNSQGMLN